jgi:hypothetical protein
MPNFDLAKRDIVVSAGQKLAAIRTTTSGTLHVTEVSG